MPFPTMQDIRTAMKNAMPAGSANLPTFPSLVTEAVRRAVAEAQNWYYEQATAEIIGDGLTQRFVLPGYDCRVVESDRQQTPTGVGTAAIAPGTVGAVTATGSGSTFAAGTHYFAAAFLSPLGRTVASAYQSVLFAAGQNAVLPALTLPTSSTGIVWFSSPGPLLVDIRQALTNTTGAGATLTAPPAATGTAPLANYTTAVSLLPDYALEQDVGVDGAAAVGAATLTLATAPSLGARVRIVYERRVTMPTLETDPIRLPEQYLLVAVPTELANLLTLSHAAGDTARYAEFFEQNSARLDAYMKRQTPTLGTRPRVPDWNT